jgi:hypothetical protein
LEVAEVPGKRRPSRRRNRIRQVHRYLLSTCLGLLAFTGSAHATFPGADGKIAFQSNRDGNFEIYSMNADGTGQTRLTFNGASDLDPSWNAAGTKIALETNRDGNFEIYTMNADGTGATRLTTNSVTDGRPSWSPDGTKIAFDTIRDGNFEIYTMNADGTGATRLTNNSASDTQPAWSPDGTTIAFKSNRDGDDEIFSMNADGTGQGNLTNNTAATDELPNWSNAGGAQIFFDRDSTAIHSIFASGSSNFSVSFSDIVYAPAPAPSSGGLFAYSSAVSGNTDIYKCTYQGTCPIRLTTNAAVDEHPDWQPVVRNYARPKGATPKRVALVPAYQPCSSPNSIHNRPLNDPSCVPPTPESSYLTVGTPDFNGVAANSIGSVLFRVTTTTPEDITINISDTDVRCAGLSGGCSSALADYVGQLTFEAAFRVTDKGNGGVGSGTVVDLPVRVGFSCSPTSSTTVGSTCSFTTSIRNLLGGFSITDGGRAIWQLTDVVKIYDGGADGSATTPGDDKLFQVDGLFAP